MSAPSCRWGAKRSFVCAAPPLCSGFLAAESYIEQITVPAYEHFVKPLRAIGDASVSSSVHFNSETKTFTGTATGPADDLSDLPNDQAQGGGSRSVPGMLTPRERMVSALEQLEAVRDELLRSAAT